MFLFPSWIAPFLVHFSSQLVKDAVQAEISFDLRVENDGSVLISVTTIERWDPPDGYCAQRWHNGSNLETRRMSTPTQERKSITAQSSPKRELNTTSVFFFSIHTVVSRDLSWQRLDKFHPGPVLRHLCASTHCVNTDLTRTAQLSIKCLRTHASGLHKPCLCLR